MAYICQCCHQIFNKDVMSLPKYNDNEILCPIYDCNGVIIEIDDLLVPIILKLWDMDFNTCFCCSGHPYGMNYETYIGFDKSSISERNFIFPFLPDGYRIEQNDRCIFLTSETTWRKGITYTFSEKLDIIIKNVKSLNHWANELEKWMYQKKAN